MSEPADSSPQFIVALDCDDFGRYSAEPIGETILPIPNRKPTFTSGARDNDGGNHVVDHDDFSSSNNESGSEFVSCESAAIAAGGCRCQHEPIAHHAVENHSRCSDSHLLGAMLALTLSFALCELIFGFVNNSLALVADSFHMFSDSAALIVAVVAIRLARRPENNDDAHTFGWRRAEVIGALINGVYLVSVCVYILLEAIFRLFDPQELENPWQILIVGVAGLFINAIGVGLFFSHRSLAQHHAHGHGHEHRHGHEHEDGHGNVKRSSANMHGVFLHIAGDALGSIAVIITALMTIYWPYWWRVYFDPVCSILFAQIILRSSLPLVVQSSKILMQSAPSVAMLDSLRAEILKIDGVVEVHDFHVWQLAQNYMVATVHLTIDSSLGTGPDAVRACNAVFCAHGVHRTTVQVEEAA